MASTQIQTLLHPADYALSVQRATKFLNDNFTTLDLVTKENTLENLLRTTESTAKSIQSELAFSNSQIESLKSTSKEKAKEQLISANELSLLRHSLVDELADLSDELVTIRDVNHSQPSLLEEIESLHRNLKELEGVKDYVEIIHTALCLSERSVEKIRQLLKASIMTEDSISDYIVLRELFFKAKLMCDKATENSGQSIKLVEVLSQIVHKTWLDIKEVLVLTLLKSAENLQWPMPIDYIAANPESRDEFERSFINLLKLQEIGDELHRDDGEISKDLANGSGLFALQALVRPVALRFRYHFEGERQTNRLDKPEWYIAHILNVSHEHRRFLEIVIQRLLQSSKYGSIVAWREFTRLLIPILAKKIRRTMPALLNHPSLLAHTIYQTLSFDEALKDAGFGLLGTLEEYDGDLEGWKGTSDIILGKKEWFDAWLEGERKFVEDQYNDIIGAADAWHIPDDTEGDAINERDVRPTNSARRVKSLVEQVTDRYKALPRFFHKTRFLIAVQVPILELYHTRISESLDAFETLSSFLVRAVPGNLASQASSGSGNKNMTAGVEGSHRLIKAYVSARWMASVMASWGEDLFFLELWHEIRTKAALRVPVQDSNALPDLHFANEDDTIFEELITQYHKLAERAEIMLVKQICGEVESDLKAHLFRRPNAEAVNDDVVLSQALLSPIARLSSHLSFLRKSLPANILVILYRKIVSHIATHILQRQVLFVGRGRMSSREGKIVLDEGNLWVETCKMVLGGSVRTVEGPWRKLLEAGRLLSLDGEAFQRIVKSVQLEGDVEYDRVLEELQISETSRSEALEILTVREDYRR